MTSPDERFLIGLIGADISSSISPALHEREADRRDRGCRTAEDG